MDGLLLRVSQPAEATLSPAWRTLAAIANAVGAYLAVKLLCTLIDLLYLL
jgi:hypothetical protein